MYSSSSLLALVFNGLTLAYFGSAVMSTMTPASFIAFYFAAGALGGIAHLLYVNWPWISGRAAGVKKSYYQHMSTITSHACTLALVTFYAVRSLAMIHSYTTR